MNQIDSMDKKRIYFLKQILKHRLLLIIIVALFIFTLNGVLTASEPKTVLLVTGEWAPYTSEKLEGYGFFTSIVTEVFKKMNMVPQYKFYPWKRCELQLEKGAAFAAFPYAFTKERAKKFWFTELMTLADDSTEPTQLFFYKKKSSDFSYNRLEDLREYKIAGIAGYYYLELFDEAGIPYDYSDNEVAAFRKLVGGRVDLVPIIHSAGVKIINKLYPDEMDHFGVLDHSIGGAGTRLMVSRSYPDAEKIMIQFDAAFKEVINNGTYLKILKKYGAQSVSVHNKQK